MDKKTMNNKAGEASICVPLMVTVTGLFGIKSERKQTVCIPVSTVHKADIGYLVGPFPKVMGSISADNTNPKSKSDDPY